MRIFFHRETYKSGNFDQLDIKCIQRTTVIYNGNQEYGRQNDNTNDPACDNNIENINDSSSGLEARLLRLCN